MQAARTAGGQEQIVTPRFLWAPGPQQPGEALREAPIPYVIVDLDEPIPYVVLDPVDQKDCQREHGLQRAG